MHAALDEFGAPLEGLKAARDFGWFYPNAALILATTAPMDVSWCSQILNTRQP